MHKLGGVLLHLPVDILGAFLEAILTIIAGVISIIGILIALVAHRILLALANLAVTAFAWEFAFNMETAIWSLLFVMLWVYLIGYRISGRSFVSDTLGKAKTKKNKE